MAVKQVHIDEYMTTLVHPLKPEIEALRKIIKGANKKIGERVSENAPAYFYKQELVTFNPRAQQSVHVVFHHPDIAKITSRILEGGEKGRRMAFFSDMADVKASKKEIERIMNELVEKIDKKK